MTIEGSDQAMARSFGAAVDLRAAEGRTLFLVVGRDRSPQPAIRSLGGAVVTRLPGGRRCIAVLELGRADALRAHPDIALAGPVSIDQERFAHFARLIQLDPPNEGAVT